MKKMSFDEYITTVDSSLYNPNDTVTIINEIPDFIKTESFQEILSRTCSMLYGEYLLRTKYVINPDKILKDVMNLYANNAYKYLGLYQSTQFDYNPLHNYDMTERSHDETDNNHNTNNQYGAQENTISEGNRTDNVQHGAHTDSDSTPSITNTQQAATSPYDTNTYYNTNKQTDTLGAVNKTLNYGEYVDVATKGEMTTHGIQGEHVDVTTSKTLNSYTHYLERQGNIGVTTSMQLIQSERDLRDFSIYNIIAKDIMCLLCVRVEQPRRYVILNR